MVVHRRTGWKHIFISAALMLALLSCGGGGGTGDGNDVIDDGAGSGEEDTQRWIPEVTDTWQWQLSGALNTTYDVVVYDIDLFDNPTDVMEQLHASGRKVICYFSAGSYEAWRSDAQYFASADLGETLDGWPDERWLDIRSSDVRQMMLSRLDLALQKGCDGVEPDNIDGYVNHTGFPLTADDQLDYNRFLANAAHERRLAIALKNDLDQVDDLVDDYDLAVNEQCHEYDECDALMPFIDAGKPVFNAEYASIYINDTPRRSALCEDALNRGFQTLVLPLDLDGGFRYSCE